MVAHGLCYTDLELVFCIYLCLTGITVSVFSYLNVCLQFLSYVFIYIIFNYIQWLLKANCYDLQYIEFNTKIKKSLNFIHILYFCIIILCYLFICSFIAHKLIRWYSSSELAVHLIALENSYCMCEHFSIFSLSLLYTFTTIIVYIILLLLCNISPHLCLLWPAVYISIIILIAFGYILYNILLTLLFNSIIMVKLISVPVWDYRHATYSCIYDLFYDIKVNIYSKRIKSIHSQIYYNIYICMFRRMNIDTEYYTDIISNMFYSVLRMNENMCMVTYDYYTLSHYLTYLYYG